MNKVYRVVFTGLQQTEEYFKSRISMLGVSPDHADKILKKAPVVLKEDKSLEYIRKYAKAITGAGGNVSIRSFIYSKPEEKNTFTIPGMSAFTQCSRCGHRQPKKVRCVRCGLHFNGPAEG